MSSKMRPRSDEKTAEKLMDDNRHKRAGTITLDDDDDEDMPEVLIDESLNESDGNRRQKDRSASSSLPPPLSPAYSSHNGFDSQEHRNGIHVEKIDEDGDDEEEEEEEEVEDKKKKVDVKKKKDVEKEVKKEAKMEEDGDDYEENEKPRVKRKYKKRVKDPNHDIFHDANAPKKNRSAYVHFMIKRRPFYGNNKGFIQRDINIALAADWQKLTPTERIPFEKAAAEEKERYAVLLSEYQKTSDFKEFQKRKHDFQKSTIPAKPGTQKRKSDKSYMDSDNEGTSVSRTKFPAVSTLCPALNEDKGTIPSTSSGPQFTGTIFTPEFITYNKARDSYRRQLQVERSRIEHELEALYDHDLEIRLRQQKDETRKIDEKMNAIMNKVKMSLCSVPAIKDQVENLDSMEELTTWMKTIWKMNGNAIIRKDLKSCLMKVSKSPRK